MLGFLCVGRKLESLYALTSGTEGDWPEDRHVGHAWSHKLRHIFPTYFQVSSDKLVGSHSSEESDFS